jgi:hypothetical protein
MTEKEKFEEWCRSQGIMGFDTEILVIDGMEYTLYVGLRVNRLWDLWKYLRNVEA